MMNAQKLQMSWNQVRGLIKERWGSLTDDDLKIKDGNVDQMVGRIQLRTGEARATIESYLDQLAERGSSMASQFAQAVGNTAHQAGDRLRAHWGQVADQANAGYDQAQRVVREHPARSVATFFGVGVAVGLLVGISLGRRPPG